MFSYIPLLSSILVAFPNLGFVYSNVFSLCLPKLHFFLSLYSQCYFFNNRVIVLLYSFNFFFNIIREIVFWPASAISLIIFSNYSFDRLANLISYNTFFLRYVLWGLYLAESRFFLSIINFFVHVYRGICCHRLYSHITYSQLSSHNV